MQHTDSVDAPLMHAAIGRWPALNADTGDTEITGWAACAEQIKGRWYTCWGFNGRAQSWERLADCPDCGTSLIEPWPLRTCCAKYHSDVPRLKAMFTHRRRRPFSSGSIGWTVHAEEWHGWPYPQLGLERSTPALASDNSLHLLWRVVGDIVTAALLCQVLPVEVPVRALCT